MKESVRGSWITQAVNKHPAMEEESSITLTFTSSKTQTLILLLSRKIQNVPVLLLLFFFQSFLTLISDLLDPPRYPLAGRLCHWCHGGHISDLQFPLHRHLRVQLGPARRRGWDGRATHPDAGSPPPRNSQGMAPISKITFLLWICTC